MYDSKLAKIAQELKVDDFTQMNQKQFNGFIANAYALDPDVAKKTLENVPNLPEYILGYFSSVNEGLSNHNQKYSIEMQNQEDILQKLLLNLKGNNNPEDSKIKENVCEQILTHSKWLSEQAKMDNMFKIAVIGIGVGIVFLYFTGFPMPFAKDNSEQIEHVADKNTQREIYYPNSKNSLSKETIANVKNSEEKEKSNNLENTMKFDKAEKTERTEISKHAMIMQM